MSRALLVMAKAPIAGFAKTRLQRETGWEPERIAEVAAAFLADVLATCRRLEDASLSIHVAPRESVPFFQAHAPHAAVHPQPEGDLGVRMAAAFEAGFQAGVTAAVMIGTDAPHLGADVLRAAFAALERRDLVLVPAEDGGYALIGLARPAPALFDGVRWSTGWALADTLAHARAARIAFELLEPTFDVDGAADLERLARLLAADPHRAPATAAVIARNSGRS